MAKKPTTTTAKVFKNLGEVAQHYGVAYSTVKGNWRSAGMPGPPYREDKIDAWKTSRRRDPAALEGALHDAGRLKLRKLAAETVTAEAVSRMSDRKDRLAAADIVSRQQVYHFFTLVHAAFRDQAMQIPVEMRNTWPKKDRVRYEKELTERLEMLLRNLAAWRPRIEDVGGEG